MGTNTNTERVIVDTEYRYKEKGLAELKKILAGTNLAMYNMEKAGKQNSDSFKNLEARSSKLTARINELKKSYTDVGKATKTVHTDTEKLSGGVKNLVSSLPLLSLGLAGVAAGLVNFAGSAFKMGADFQELSSNFVGGAKDLELFRKATAGTVSDGGLIQLSNYASDLGISLKDQALLFSLAEDAADKYGGTVPDNFERVINATDGSAKGLRAVGLSVKQYNDELEKLLPTSVKTIDDLDAETQQAIRLQAILNLTGVTIDDVNKKQQSNADVIANLGILYDEFAVSVGLAMNENLKLADSMDGLTSKTQILGNALGQFLAEGLSRVSEMLKQDYEDITKLSNAFDNLLSFMRTMDSMDIFDKITFLMNGGVGMINTSGTNKNEPLKTFPPEFTLGGSLKLPIPNFETTGIGKTKTGSRGGGTTKDTGLSDAEKEKLRIKEAILVINSRGEAEFLELTKIKVPQTTDNKGLTNNDWMAGMSDKELQSFLALENTPEEQSSTLLSDSETIYNNISSLMNILNVGTDTFVGKLLAGFNTAFQIMDIASSILSFIPGFGSIFGKRASGGMVNASGTYIVGEQGPEILQMSGSGGMIYNNSQTNKLMNQSLNKSNPINVYVSSNIDQRYLKVGIEKYNANQKYIRV